MLIVMGKTPHSLTQPEFFQTMAKNLLPLPNFGEVHNEQPGRANWEIRGWT
jgi:hypothetical protein